jgi:hypothetical protein
VDGSLPDHVAVVHGELIQVVRDMGYLPLNDAVTTTVTEVGNTRNVPAVFDRVQKLKQRFLGAVTTDHVINFRIPFQDLTMKIRGGQSSKYDWYVRVQSFEKTGHLYHSLDVRQPVKIKAEQTWSESGQIFFRVEAVAPEHLHGQIQDPNIKTSLGKIVRQGNKTDRIHLKDRCGWNHIGNGAIKDGAIAKIENAGSVD